MAGYIGGQQQIGQIAGGYETISYKVHDWVHPVRFVEVVIPVLQDDHKHFNFVSIGFSVKFFQEQRWFYNPTLPACRTPQIKLPRTIILTQIDNRNELMMV